MIRNETEYREAVKRLSEEQGRLAQHRARLKETGLTKRRLSALLIRWNPSTYNLRKRLRATNG
jgi:hypothetical protein